MEDVNGSGLRPLVDTLHLSVPQTKIQQQDDWTWRSTQGNKHRIDFLGIAEAVQPHVHFCAPTDVMMFGSGHFQEHRAVVLDFSTVEMTNPQVARQYRAAICDRQLLLQESVQCSLQQWWQATPRLPTRPHPEPKRCALGEVDALWSQLRGTTNQEKAEATMDGSRYARSSAQRIRLETAVV